MTQVAMSVGTIVEQGVGVRLIGSADAVVSGVQHDSRQVQPGDLFVAIRGEHHDGLDYVDAAIERGASAVLAEREVALKAPLLLSSNARLDLAKAAELVYGTPTETLAVVGVTGTNGKTSVTHLLEAVVTHAQGHVALLGTTGARIGTKTVPAMHTTPEADDVSRFAARAVEEGATHLLMEVSSHGLAMHRVDAVDFGVAAFTNLTQDHLDFHKTIEAYGDSKARLFLELTPRVSVINIDDEFGQRLSAHVQGEQVRCSRRPDADAEVRVLSAHFDENGVRATVQVPSGMLELRSPLIGEHNLENLLIASTLR